MTTTFRPLRDRVLVQRFDAEEKIGAIIVPDKMRGKSQRGTVIAAGPGRLSDDGVLLAPDVKVGDMVCFGRYAGEDVNEKKFGLTLDGEEFVLMREDEIFAVLTGSEIIAP